MTMKFIKPIIPLTVSACVLAMVAGPVAAQPDDPEPQSEPQSETLSDLREKAKALADKARAGGDAFVDSDMIASMSELLADLAARVDLEQGEGSGTALLIDGDELVRFNGTASSQGALRITGLGENLSVERETILKDGKIRTRIVIEMDGGADVDIHVPDAPQVSVPPLDQE